MPPCTLDHWRLNLRQHGYVLAPSKVAGAHHKLMPRNEEIFVGFVYDEYCNNREFHLDTALGFLSTSLFVSMDESTACRYLNDNSFSSHRTWTKRAGFAVCDEQLALVAKQWLLDFHEQYVPIYQRKSMYSLDFTYGSWHKASRTSMRQMGFQHPSPMPNLGPTPTALWTARGAQVTKSCVFTHDEHFNPRGQHRLELALRLANSTISANCFFYVPGNKKYKREHKDMISSFAVSL